MENGLMEWWIAGLEVSVCESFDDIRPRQKRRMMFIMRVALAKPVVV